MVVVLLRQHKKQEQQQQDWHVLRLFPLRCYLYYRLVVFMISCCLLMFLTTRTTAAAATRREDGQHHAHAHPHIHDCSRIFGQRSIQTTFTTKPNREASILDIVHNVNNVKGIIPRCAGCAKSSSLSSASSSSSIQGLLRSRQTTTAKGATLSFRGGGGGVGHVVSSSVQAILTSIGESKTKCWILLIVCILAETWATLLSKTARDEQSPSIFAASLLLYSACMLGFNIALSKIEVGIAYAVWSALGTLVVTYIGIVCFGESFDLYKLLCLALIVVGVIGLNIREDHQ